MVQLDSIRPRRLMGPGPSDVHPRVLAALARPTIGHLDPRFLGVLNDIREMLQAVFQTRNELTLAVSGTGSAGMETCLVNLLEPGDRVIIGVAGVFGQRMTDVAGRCGAEVTTVEVPWGRVIPPERLAAALADGGPYKLVGVVHAETSTGACQPIAPLAPLCREHGALLLVDCVTSLGGLEVDIDGWGVDVAYSGTQKCLSCPPSLSPVTFGERAVAALDARRGKVQSWYLDLSMVRQYWGSERLYHHTAPINSLYGLHEALRIVLEEGLPARWARHARVHAELHAGLTALGLPYLADPAHQLPMLNAVGSPAGVDESTIRRRLLDEHDIEIGGGLGEFKGRAWRIGIMGESATSAHVEAVCGGLGEVMG